MSTPINTKLYEKAKQIIDKRYSKQSAYKSGALVKLYKELGGQYENTGMPHQLSRWYKEHWKDVGNKDYPVYRPTVKVNEDTPLTIDEIDPKNLKKQIQLKQIFRGKKNLPPFKKFLP